MNYAQLTYKISEFTGNEEDEGEYVYETVLDSAFICYFANNEAVVRKGKQFRYRKEQIGFNSGIIAVLKEILSWMEDTADLDVAEILMGDEKFMDYAKKIYFDDAYNEWEKNNG